MENLKTFVTLEQILTFLTTVHITPFFFLFFLECKLEFLRGGVARRRTNEKTFKDRNEYAIWSPFCKGFHRHAGLLIILEHYSVTLDLKSLLNTSATTYAKFFNQNQMGIIMQAVG